MSAPAQLLQEAVDWLEAAGFADKPGQFNGLVGRMKRAAAQAAPQDGEQEDGLEWLAAKWDRIAEGPPEYSANPYRYGLAVARRQCAHQLRRALARLTSSPSEPEPVDDDKPWIGPARRAALARADRLAEEYGRQTGTPLDRYVLVEAMNAALAHPSPSEPRGETDNVGTCEVCDTRGVGLFVHEAPAPEPRYPGDTFESHVCVVCLTRLTLPDSETGNGADGGEDAGWTTDLPDAEGWWWMAERGEDEPVVIFVEGGPDGDFWIHDSSVAVDELHPATRWSGPLLPPGPAREDGE